MQASSLANTIAPAPSQMPDAVPAVTVPFFLKTGGNYLPHKTISIDPTRRKDITSQNEYKNLPWLILLE